MMLGSLSLLGLPGLKTTALCSPASEPLTGMTLDRVFESIGFIVFRDAHGGPHAIELEELNLSVQFKPDQRQFKMSFSGLLDESISNDATFTKVSVASEIILSKDDLPTFVYRITSVGPEKIQLQFVAATHSPLYGRGHFYCSNPDNVVVSTVSRESVFPNR